MIIHSQQLLPLSQPLLLKKLPKPPKPQPQSLLFPQPPQNNKMMMIQIHELHPELLFEQLSLLNPH